MNLLKVIGHAIAGLVVYQENGHTRMALDHATMLAKTSADLVTERAAQITESLAEADAAQDKMFSRVLKSVSKGR